MKDTTPAAARRAHDAAFPSLVGYAEAFKKAEAAVLTNEDSPESPRALLREWAADDGRSWSDAQLKRELQKRFAGLELLPPGEVDETYVESATHWVFAVDLDVGTDHGFWACVDRQTGEVSVEGFN